MNEEVTSMAVPAIPATETAAPRADVRGPGRKILARTERLRALVLHVLATTPAGLTADEVAARLGESVLAVRPRVSELFHAGLIEKTGDRRANASGLAAHVWKKAPAGGA
jgi:predicted ArsR family transcriptional regulator